MSEETIKIRSATKEYRVHISDDMAELLRIMSIPDALFVVDCSVFHLYGDLFKSIPAEKIYALDAVEERKSIQTALDICEWAISRNARRSTTLVSFGGGITQDVTGFVSNILYRGIRWIYVPTTLLAACDSCIGGKTSLNYGKYKNLLGTFFPPDEIYICTRFFKTLSKRDLLSGMGEIIKFNLIQDESTLSELENSIQLLLDTEPVTVNHFLVSSLKFKQQFIEVDEFDRGERIKLNFAHTFGHAYEVASNYKIPHGMAVSMGMISANHISVKRGLMPPSLAERMEALLRMVIDVELAAYGFDFDAILSAIRKDKKQTNKGITAILLNENFDLLLVHDIRIEEIEAAVGYLSKLLT